MKKIVAKILYIGTFAVSSCNASADVVTIEGKVIDQSTQKPISGITVALFKLKGRLKFWTLPEQSLISSSVSTASGQFKVSGSPGRYYVLELIDSSCVVPFKKVFDVRDDGVHITGVEIECVRPESR